MIRGGRNVRPLKCIASLLAWRIALRALARARIAGSV